MAFAVISLLVLLMQSFIFNRFAYHKLEYSCQFSTSEAYEGEEIELIEVVHNKKLLPVPWLKVDIHTSKWLDFASTRSVISQENRRVSSSFLLKSYQKTTRRWKVRCLKRGYFDINGITLLSGDLLGFRNTSISVPSNIHLTVYPTIVDIEDIFISPNNFQGDIVVKRWIMDDPFITQGTREYTSSDPMNRIHWLCTARYNKLMVRKNDFTAQLNTCVLLNIQSADNEVDTVFYRNLIEFAIKVSATLLEQSFNAGIPSRFGTNAAVQGQPHEFILTETGAGQEHVMQLFNLLSMLELRNVRSFEFYLEFLEEKIENMEIYIVTAYVSRSMIPALSYLYKNNNRIKLFVMDQLNDISYIPDYIDIYYLNREKHKSLEEI